MKKKVLGFIATALLAFPLLSMGAAANADTANAAADPSGKQTVNIDLHKLVFDKGTTPTSTPNDGLTNPFNTGHALSGAEFTMYDVSTKYNELLSQGKSPEDAIKAIQADYQNNQASKISALTTGADGVASFTKAPIAKDGKFAAYLFVETKVPSGATDKATPLVVAMPVYSKNNIAFLEGNKDGAQDLGTINLYPKNEAKELVEKVKSTDKTSFTVGEKVPYKVTVNVPADETKTFVVNDKPSAGLQVLLDDTFVVQSDGTSLVKGTDYTVVKNTNNGGYSLTLTTPEKWIGRQIIIDYNMEVTTTASLVNGLLNDVSVDTDTKKDSKPGTPVEPVFTGGYNFIKEDANSKEKLAGVEFQVKDKEGNVLSFVKQANGEWVIADSTATGASATIVTQTDGTLSVTGLKAGDYTLVETKPADGYVLPANPNTAFTVITNEKGNGTYTVTKTTPIEVTNVKKGILPSTGGSGIYAFLVIGAALMAGAAVWYKKSKNSAEA